MRLVFEIINVASFIKINLYLKRGSIKIRKHVETFHANKVYNLVIVVFIRTLLFSKQKFVVHFSNVISTKTRPCTPIRFIWICITSTLSLIRLEINGNVLRTWDLVFPKGPFYRGPFFLGSRVQVWVWFLCEASRKEAVIRPYCEQSWMLL